MRLVPLPLTLLFTVLGSAGFAQSEQKGVGPKPTEKRGSIDPVAKSIEGWIVHIDPALLKGEHAEMGSRALRMLADHLNRISLLVQGDPLVRLKKCEIWIEREHPSLRAMQYHPSESWLRRNGHDIRLTKKVHIPRAEALVSRSQLLKHPAVVLHELSHAYHDQFLGFDYKPIVDSYNKAMQDGTYEKVLLHTGSFAKHYGATNPKEYFAEGTEAYFYRNDFYPFVRAELKEHDPTLHAELEEIWGPAR
ncbi:metallopeptidase [Pirellulales bacterium]|nr:metallopeptidase [Pirellulales bacterium]